MNRSTPAALSAVVVLSLVGMGIASAGEPDVGQGGRTFSLVPAAKVIERCGTVDEGAPKNAPLEEEIQRLMVAGRVAAGGVIPVHVHVLYSGNSGNIPQSWIDAQILVLNRNYAGRDYNGNLVPGASNTGYTFVLASVDRTSNRKWFGMGPGTGNERNAKNALSIDPTGSLNLYTANPGGGLLGWSTFPWDLSQNGKLDGVVVHYNSLPGGSLAPYNLGGTASHEVGHWVGLYHTFQGGCGSDCTTTGDLVCDTPAEQTATSGCPSGKDTCPAAGLDPIHNYMDYSTDLCYDQFTTGQDARADFMMSTYRPIIGSAARIGTIVAMAAKAAAPTAFGLRVSPNPFNPRTKVEFSMAREGNVTLRVFDIQGRTVATIVNGRISQGPHSYEMNGDHLASGIYHMQLRVDGNVIAKQRITLLK